MLNRVQDTSGGDYDKYYKLIQKSESESKIFLSLLSTNKTNFFRHPSQFRTLSDHVLPEILAAKAPRDELRVLSAGCSRGAELYSILMLLQSSSQIGQREVSALGIDIDSAELDIARAGLYPEENMLDISPELKKKFFKPLSSGYQLSSHLITQARFEFFNLMKPLTFGSFDIIYCRNCLIYFKEANKNRITEELFRSLKIGGYLFLSPNEYIRDDYHGALIERELGGERVYHKINPQKVVHIEYHFASNREIMKIQNELMQQNLIEYKLMKYRASRQGNSRNYYLLKQKHCQSFERLIRGIDIEFIEKKENSGDEIFF